MSSSNTFLSQRLALRKRGSNIPHHVNYWYPLALRWWNLVSAILFCWTFIAILQYHLSRSQRDGGVIFATNIDDLPLGRSFSYRYLPTVVAVTFSIFVLWIDNDARRYEPYRLMLRPAGALANDSILLHYPFNFTPLVPFKSFRRGHWMVFWASTATFITTFGVVPLQAGIFSTEKVTRTSEQQFLVPREFVPSISQTSTSFVRSAQSVYGLLCLNETIPEFMTLNYTLSPFTPLITSGTHGSEEIWTSTSTMFGVDLECNQITPTLNEQGLWYNITEVCRIVIDDWAPHVIGDKQEWITNVAGKGPEVQIKTYSSFLTSKDSIAAIWPDDPNCTLDSGFFTAFLHNKPPQMENVTIPRDEYAESYKNITAVACVPHYYERQVEATVDAKAKTPIKVKVLGPETSLAERRFNMSMFEVTLMSGFGQLDLHDRSDGLPDMNIPRYLSGLYNSDLTPFMDWGIGELGLHPLAAMVLSTSDHKLEDFLDSQVLAEGFETAYRLLFARAMNSILKSDFSEATTTIIGRRDRHLEAVIMQPVLTYIVEALLAFVSLSMFALLFFSVARKHDRGLCDDPGSLATTMSMVADSSDMLRAFEALDCCTKDVLVQSLDGCTFTFRSAGIQFRAGVISTASSSQQHTDLNKDDEKEDRKIAKPIRPSEFRLYTAVPFVSFLAVFLTALTVLWVESRGTGLPLPSQNRLVQNILTKYLPTAIATLIEPVWVLLNRLLCVLQPLEELRTSKASASRSLAINYAYLPPQLVAFRALRARHFLLAVVCAMTLLSNLLATSFAGLFFLDTITIAHEMNFRPPLHAQFVRIDGTAGPQAGDDGTRPGTTDSDFSGAYQGGVGEDQFLILESNYTRNTTLIPWLGKTAAYLPFKSAGHDEQGHEFQAQTLYLSAASSCKPLAFGTDYKLDLAAKNSDDETFEVSVSRGSGLQTTCYPSQSFTARPFGTFHTLLGTHCSRSSSSCQTGKVAAELLINLQARPNATQIEQETCMTSAIIGWMRTMQASRQDFNEDKVLLMLCQPQLEVGTAQIRVDANGVLLDEATNVTPDPDQSGVALANYTTNGVENVIGQSNLFLFRELLSEWHNDSYSSENFHYFVNRARGDTQLTDPNAPIPTPSGVEEAIKEAYARLFATWVAVNRDLLFLPATNDTIQMEGFTVIPEERLFLNFPMFIISEIILGIYVIVSVLVYVRRPGRYLPRMPISIAAVVALFAPSAAVKDLRNTSSMTNKLREKHLKDLDYCYGYGSYIGSDGAVHVGIEKAPYVQCLKEVTFIGSKAERELEKRTNKKGGSKTRVGSTESCRISLENGE
ncbi:hypothetical protein EJ07DRAFT_165987 [Lizonia empirigonia]|nr:hypothetical protein EJ07DRAFT_165987 [Lizonia empirigonia]